MDASAPPDQQNQGLWYPLNPSPLIWNTFGGIDTQSSRPAINEKMCAVIDGFFPEGDSNLRTLYGVGPSIYGAAAGKTVIMFGFVNIGATPYCIVFLSDGSVIAVNTTTKATTTVMTAGTIANPSIPGMGMSQWGNQYLIVTANQSNGFWLWDGTNLYSAGTLGPDVTINNNGASYTSAPTVTTFGGSGSGGTFSVILQDNFVQQISVINPGHNYSNVDAAVLVFSGGGSPGRTAQIGTTVTSGSISAVSIFDGGAGYNTSSASVQILGGGGVGAQLTLSISGGSVSSVSISKPGEGYSSASPPVVSLTDPNNPVAQATVDIMPFGISGTASEVFTSRLWVVNGNRMQYTAPGSVVNFNGSSGGGAFPSTDSFLRNSFTQPKQTNGFLFNIADSSMNYISGVNTSAGTSLAGPSTTFTNQNADPEIGTSWPATVNVFSRNIIFANSFGVHVSYGGALSKVSDPLDGLWNTVPNFGGLNPSSAKAIIFGKKIYMVLLPVIDPITSQQVNKLFMWNGKLWFTSQQDVNLIFIAGQEINSTITAYGTDGTNIYPLFQNPSTGFVKTVRSRLWDRPGHMLVKTVGRLWGLAVYYSILAPNLTVSIDNEMGASNTTVSLGPVAVTITNNAGHTVAVTNNAAQPVTVYATGNGNVAVFPPTAVGQQGALMGFTVQTSAADMALISLAIDDNIQSYRG